MEHFSVVRSRFALNGDAPLDDGVGQEAEFWKLAQVLSALYPAGTSKKRWVDGVLGINKKLGL